MSKKNRSKLKCLKKEENKHSLTKEQNSSLETRYLRLFSKRRRNERKKRIRKEQNFNIESFERKSMQNSYGKLSR